MYRLKIAKREIKKGQILTEKDVATITIIE